MADQPSRGHDPLAEIAADALLRRLGPDVGPRERVDGGNPAHAGQTFDFAARRVDGSWLAIEVTQAADERWMRSAAAWTKVIEELRLELDGHVLGSYWIVVPAMNVSARQHFGPVREAILHLKRSEKNTHAEQVGPEKLSVRKVRVGGPLELSALPMAAEFERGPESVARFQASLDRKRAVMMNAGAKGYETHLVVVTWLLGRPSTWCWYLSENPITDAHPMRIWAFEVYGSSPPDLVALWPSTTPASESA